MTPRLWPTWYKPFSHPSIERVIAKTAHHFDLTTAAITGDAKATRVAHPRQLAMLLASRETGRSSTVIARQFGDRDHSTILHGVEAARARILDDPRWKAHYDAIKGALSA